MTTSAININIVDRKPARVCSTPNDVTVPITCVVSGMTAYRFEKKLRPASSTVGISKGWRACKAWSHSGHTWSYDGGSVRVVTKQTGYNRVAEYPDGTYWGSFTPPTSAPVPSGLINRAEQDALLKLKDQKFNLGQFAAEWKQTARLLAGTAITIARQVRHFRRQFPEMWKEVKHWQTGGARCKRENWHKIPRKWLELQYGWLPLLSDVYGALAHLQKDRLPEVHVKSHKRDTALTSYRVTGISNPGTNYCTLEFDTHFDVWVSLWYELNSPALAEFSSLGLINPVEIMWEVLPYSFVVDWFLPVGPWLSSMTADVGFAFKGGSLSRLSKVRGVRFTSGVMQTGTTTVTGPFPKANGESFQFTRTCYNSSPVPGLYIKNPLSATHVANAIALLVVAFGRR